MPGGKCKEGIVAELNSERIRELQVLARDARAEIVSNVHKAKCGHPGGSLSAVELLVSLYFQDMNIDPSKPDWYKRDRFVLSKGHASIGLYTILAMRGYFPLEELATFDRIDSRMQAHPDMNMTPGVDMSSGSLGQGISVAAGIALGAKLRGQDFKVFVMLGDGELQEGQVWEAAFMAQRYELDNLIALVDLNQVQLYGWQHPEPRAAFTKAADKFSSFGWQVLEVDGHDFPAILDALQNVRSTQGKPSVIIANTIKGKGVSFMEGQYAWHAVAPNDEECACALEELGRC
jgi:transketolase